jgi:hypothetical protein
MNRVRVKSARPDIDAAVSQAMDGEGVPGQATMEQALYCRQIYTEILGTEEKVLKRIRQLMPTQSGAAWLPVMSSITTFTFSSANQIPGGGRSGSPR